MRAWMLRAGLMLAVWTLLGMLSSCSHDPNHEIDMAQARAAAGRVHTPPRLNPSDRAKMMQDHGG